MKYRILNPRGIAKGVRILYVDDPGLEMYAGDVVTPPPVWKKADIAELIKRGFLEEVGG